jgi:hypothetical protein
VAPSPPPGFDEQGSSKDAWEWAANVAAPLLRELAERAELCAGEDAMKGEAMIGSLCFLCVGGFWAMTILAMFQEERAAERRHEIDLAQLHAKEDRRR